MAEAMEWVSKITTVGLMMALPAAFGVWLDSKLGTLPIFLLIFVVFGLVGGFYLLLKMVGAFDGRTQAKNRPY